MFGRLLQIKELRLKYDDLERRFAVLTRELRNAKEINDITSDRCDNMYKQNKKLKGGLAKLEAENKKLKTEIRKQSRADVIASSIDIIINQLTPDKESPGKSLGDLQSQRDAALSRCQGEGIGQGYFPIGYHGINQGSLCQAARP